jgi:hypothetical protein
MLVAGKVFTHKCNTGKLSALIQCWNIVQQIERDGFQRCQTYVHIYTCIYKTLKFLALQGAPYIYDISRLRVNSRNLEQIKMGLILCCTLATLYGSFNLIFKNNFNNLFELMLCKWTSYINKSIYVHCVFIGLTYLAEFPKNSLEVFSLYLR